MTRLGGPMQLPTCLRRLYGTTIIVVVAPIVEPLLSPGQAAVSGSDCGANIRAVYAHLEGGARQPSEGDRTLWQDVLGPLAAAADSLSDRADLDTVRYEPAVVFADQSKAFERVSYTWLRQVLEGWNMPRWLIRALLMLVTGRSVRTLSGPTSRPQTIRRSVGMGGTASPFCWVLAYDPIVAGLHVATGAQDPTFVDDLAALVWGARQAVRAMLFLLAAGHAAGLLAEGHMCAWVECTGLSPAARSALAHLPVVITEAGAVSALRGVDADTLCTLLSHAVPHWCAEHWIRRTTCTCGIKTAVVPASQRDQWRLAMTHSPFRADSVVDTWQYLGVGVAGLTMTDVGRAPVYTQDALRAVQQATWGRALRKADLRARGMLAAQASPGRRAALWNTYVTSLVTYQAQTCPPSLAAERQLQDLFRAVFPTHQWAPWWLTSALGPLFRVAGSPRCPVAAALHAAGTAQPRHGGWGCTAHRRAQQDQWLQLTNWASDRLAVGGAGVDDDALAVQHVRDGGDLDEVGILLRRHGGALYRGAWRKQYETRARAWCQRRSGTRRWWRTDGAEWAALSECSTFTAAFHVLRLLAGGLGG